VPCEILTSEVEQYTGGAGKVHFRARIRYRYEVAGQSYTSEQIRAKGTSGYSEFAANQRLVDRFPAKLKTECHVNPQDPTEAVLAPRPEYFLPLIAIGLMLIWAVYEHVAIGEWLGQRRARKEGNRKPLSEMRPRRRWVMQFLIGVMSAMFAGILIGFMQVYPWWRAMHASNWVATPCRILQSQVKTETHHQGWSFKADISFGYTVDGHQHVSQNPDFSQEMGTSYADTEALVRAFPAGTADTCYVNPVDPDDAVLRRTCRVNWFMTLFMIAWFSLGCFLMGNGLIIRFRPLLSALPWETAKGRALATKAHVNLAAAQNPMVMFLLSVAGAIVCGVLAVWLGWGVVRSLGRGGFDLLPACYAAISAFGLVMSLIYARQFLSRVRNPSPKLRLRPALLVAGQRCNVEWLWKGGQQSARPFRLWLEGHEEAYVSGTTVTLHGPVKDEKLQKVSFARKLLADVPADTTGTRDFSLPPDIMPSFGGVSVRVVWHLRVEVLTKGASSFHEYRILIRPPAG